MHIEASKSIISVATAFEAIPETASVAKLVRSLQLLEKEKLHCVRNCIELISVIQKRKVRIDKKYLIC